MKTGMEPFTDFCKAVAYAVAQFRIEYRNWREYQNRLRQSPRTSQHGDDRTACAQTRSIS